MSERTLRFIFDYESPNAYIAWMELPRLEETYGLHLELTPVLYAGLLDAHGSVGPGEISAKGRWMTRDLLRKSARLGVPLNPPPHFPFNPLLALRVSLLDFADETRRCVIQALFEAVWVRELHVSELAIVERVLDELDLPAAELLEQAQSPEIKTLLRSQTDEVAARGVFGVPAMEVDGEIFWGYDDFPHLELFLAGEDPLDPQRLADWAKPRPASSNRRAYR
ncbi:MAG: 2-hydroxychromene-2-carboxylate isomerase [Acidobacteriota bacterium]|nr:2-hydroxychromene-2-carboxylate isomerase [Acidobacteriota bacterium]